MTIGQKLKKLRADKGMTQKDLADQLHVSFQTISKWEKDENEPDLTTIRELAKLYGVSTDYLLSEDETPLKQSQASAQAIDPTPTKIQIDKCRDCGKALYQGDVSHQLERKTNSGIKEIVTVCDDCFNKHEELNKRRAELNKPVAKPVYSGPLHRITNRKDSRPLIWAIVIGILAAIAVLIACVVNYQEVGIGWTIAAPLLSGYAIMATIYCIFTASYISDVFLSVASWSIKLPGVIFTWDLNGIAWLIVMKISLAILGFLLGVATLLLALAISGFLSVFSFVPLLIYNKTNY